LKPTGYHLADHITPRESELTSPGSWMTRELDQPPNGAKQMTVEETGAAPDQRPPAFTEAELLQAAAEVRRLQARIVKATEAGRWNKVKALQYLLTHSHSAKVLAVQRVAENEGRRTPGVDGET
jgi:RNA-directed DNA polymerase